jgi:ATP-binding cassette subfamily B protein
MTGRMERCAWPVGQLGDALQMLARRGGLPLRDAEIAPPPAAIWEDERELAVWLDAAAEWIGVEAEPVEATYSEVRSLGKDGGPAIIRISGNRFLALLQGSRRAIRLLGPDQRAHAVTPEEFQAALAGDLTAAAERETETLLEESGVPARRRRSVSEIIVRERLRAEPVAACWMLRLPPGAPFWLQCRAAGIPGKLVAFAALHTVEYLLWIASWWIAGQAALQGRMDAGWMTGWALLLLTLVPLRMAATWVQGRTAITGGALLKKRLMHGALRMEPDEIRTEGAGQLLGRVIESEEVESLALSGGFLGAVSLIEIAIASAVLGMGAGGAWQSALPLAWTGLILFLSWGYLMRYRAWASHRVGMTNALVEKMVGYRTRIAQERPEDRHQGEDQNLDRYLQESLEMDRAGARLMALAPQGWMLVGLLGLAPVFAGAGASPAAFAVSIGGILLAYRAFKRLAGGLWQMSGAVVAWQQVAPLFHAAGRPRRMTSPEAAARSGGSAAAVEAHDLVFRYRQKGEPVLRGCSLRIGSRDRILLEGSSGGGKSTMAAMLTGMRAPESGLLLAGGADWHTLGESGWRRRVCSAPQFHENHILSGTLAFNLLMGRRWPAEQEDLDEAETVCRELGLGPLLDRMPSGLAQVIGEGGWQLSHGERSRLFIARALLQNTDLVILDESFAALDPENLHTALDCVLTRAPALLVIAHP